MIDTQRKQLLKGLQLQQSKKINKRDNPLLGYLFFIILLFIYKIF